MRWCLTVPAGLSQASMDIMRKAALSAGIIPSLQSPSLLLATEPEAAALTAQQQKDLLGLTHGVLTHYVACTYLRCFSKFV